MNIANAPTPRRTLSKSVAEVMRYPCTRPQYMVIPIDAKTTVFPMLKTDPARRMGLNTKRNGMM